MHRPYRDRFRLQAAARDERGTAAVEFALLAPVLCLLAAGAIESSRLIAQTMQVRAAAQAGADFALRQADWNLAGVQSAVATATPLTVTATPAPAYSTGCVVGQAVVAATGPLCPSGGAPARYATISARASYQPLFPWPALPAARTLQADTLVRIP